MRFSPTEPYGRFPAMAAGPRAYDSTNGTRQTLSVSLAIDRCGCFMRLTLSVEMMKIVRRREPPNGPTALLFEIRCTDSLPSTSQSRSQTVPTLTDGEKYDRSV